MIVVLMGGTASGKDTLQNKINARYNMPICVSSTTRPMREGEINHVTYHFIFEEQFNNDLNNNKFIEHRVYNTVYGKWYYGLSKDSINLNINQIVILDQQGYYNLINAVGQNNVIGVYITIPERIRVDRALNRETKDDKEFYREQYRRLLDDLFAFEEVENDANVYKIENIDINKAMKQIEKILINNKIV